MLFRKQLFIQLKTNQLTLAIAQKKLLSRSIYIINVSNIKIDPTTFNNSIIHNPSIISRHIQEFLKHQKIYKPQTVVSIPELNQKQDLMLTLAILQVTLCISKAKLVIKQVINEPLFDAESNFKQNANSNSTNLLNHLGNHKIKSPIFWITSTLACIIIATIAIKNIYAKTKLQISSLETKIKELKLETEQINTQIKDYSYIKEQNNKIKCSLKALEKLKNISKNPISHLIFISSKTPSNLYLTNISFNKKDFTQKHPDKETPHQKTIQTPSVTLKTNLIELEGITESIQVANKFIMELSKNTVLFNKIEFLHIKKIKNSKRKQLVKNASKSKRLKYRFKASGTLNYIC